MCLWTGNSGHRRSSPLPAWKSMRIHFKLLTDCVQKLCMKSALQKKVPPPASPAPASGVLSLSKPAVPAVLGVEPWPPRAFSRPQFHQSLFSHLPPQPPWVPQSAGTIIPWFVSSEINTAHAPHVDRSLRTAQPCSIKGALTRWGKRPRSLPRPPR
jgi:hypothetical protein